MSHVPRFTLATALLALSTAAGTAQVYPLTNGPDGTAPNVVDSASGFVGGNAVASEREFLYHPERAGNAAAQLGITAAPAGDPSTGVAAVDRRARHARRRTTLR